MTLRLIHPSFACETPPEDVWRTVQKDWFQSVGFCDWISIYQVFDHGSIPILNNGAVVIYDANGELETMIHKRAKVMGSYDSAIMIRSDGTRLEFSGNVSKFNRPDNVFGYSFTQCIEKINHILRGLGFPPFTEGERMMVNSGGNLRSVWTGAKLTRLDITENFTTGSSDDASRFMRFLQSQQASRLKTGVYGSGETVDYGRGSRSVYFKCYVKAPELRRHGKGEYIERLADWCDAQGIVRAELTLHARLLKDLGCSYLGGFNMPVIEQNFVERCKVFTRSAIEAEQLPPLSPKMLGVLEQWRSGVNIAGIYSRATYFRYRAALLPHGFDIAVPSQVRNLPVRTRVITLGRATPPSFYEQTGT